PLTPHAAGNGAAVEEDARLGLGERVAQLVRPVTEVERYVDGAELGDGEVDRRVLEAVRGERRHAVATVHPEGAERMREAVRQLVEAVVRDPVRPDDVRGPPGTVARVAPHDLSQEQGHWAPL